MAITIEGLTPTVLPSRDHVFPAMKDGLTVKLTVGQVLDLLIDSAPGTLDTLNEIAAALGDDPDFSATILAALAKRVRVDAAGGYSTAEKLQARTNIAAEVAAIYAAKSGAYTALAADNNAVLRFTSAATLSLTAAATLAANWHITVVANGGAVTIDPNGSETINGLATMIVPNGTSAEIICDGSGFFTVIKPSGWQFIEKRVLTAASGADFVPPSSFTQIHLKGYIEFPVTTDLGLRFSDDGGASFISSALYGWQVLVGTGVSVPAARTNPDSYIILSSSPTVLQFEATISNMNSNTLAPTVLNHFTEIAGGDFAIGISGGNMAAGTAKNALRLFSTTGGTMTGSVTIEGMV